MCVASVLSLPVGATERRNVLSLGGERDDRPALLAEILLHRVADVLRRHGLVGIEQAVERLGRALKGDVGRDGARDVVVTVYPHRGADRKGPPLNSSHTDISRI